MHSTQLMPSPEDAVVAVDPGLQEGIVSRLGQPPPAGWFLRDLASGRVARADEAVAAWAQALVLMEGMTSDRTRKAITSIRSTLVIYQRRKVPGAADLAGRAREALA